MDTTDVLNLLGSVREVADQHPVLDAVLGALATPDRGSRAWTTFKRRRRLVRRVPSHVVAAWMRLDAAMGALAIGTDEFAAAVEAAIEHDPEALDELRRIAPELAALVDDLDPDDDDVLTLREFVAAFEHLLLTLEAVQPQYPHVEVDVEDPPTLRQITRVILRHGPTSVSRELLAA